MGSTVRTDLAPGEEELKDLLGQPLFSVWKGLCDMVESNYEMDHGLHSGGKVWDYEYKYRRGGKTLCALYARKNCLGFMIIFGAAEQAVFEQDRQSYSAEIHGVYDETKTYHDGKWLMFYPQDTTLFPDLERLLKIKRKPNKK